MRRDGEKKRKSSINTLSHNAPTVPVSALLIYGSTTTIDGSATTHQGGATNADDASAIRYGAGTIQAGSATVASRPPTNVQDLVVVMWQFPKLWHQKVSEYDQEIPQSHTADQPTAPWGKAT